MTERAPSAYQPPLPINDLPVGMHVHAPGEMFPGRAPKVVTPVDLPSGGTWTPREPVSQETPPLPSDTDEDGPSGSEQTSDSDSRFSASRIASEQALHEAGITDVSVSELPIAFAGVRAWHHRRKASKIEGKISDDHHGLEMHQEWGKAAMASGMYKNDHRPKTRRERRLAHKKATIKVHHAHNNASKKQLEYKSNIAYIDPATGVSRRRKNGSLDHLPKWEQKRIKKGERKWKKLGHHIEHEEHQMVPHGHSGEGSEKLERKLAKHQRKARAAEVAKTLKPVRRAARSTYRAEIAKAWRTRTENSLSHREEFYNDLGNTLGQLIDNPEARVTTPQYEHKTEGGLIEGLARVRGARHKNILNYHRARGSERPIARREEIVLRRSAKYREHGFTTLKRTANRKGLRLTSKAVTDRHAKLRQTKQRVRETLAETQD